MVSPVIAACVGDCTHGKDFDVVDLVLRVMGDWVKGLLKLVHAQLGRE